MNYDSFCKHFLEVFDEVVVVGRLFDIEDPAAKPVTGDRARFIPLPSYSGPIQFAKNIIRIIKTLNSLFDSNTVYILRVPGTIPSLFSLMAFLRKAPFATQCVADPADQLGKGSVHHPLRRLFRSLFIHILRWQCQHSVTSMYVTKKSLQIHYPPALNKPTYSYTDLVLNDSSYVSSARSNSSFNINKPVIVNVGMMVQLYKGQDVLLEAVKCCVTLGLDVSLRLIGDGEYRQYLEDLAVQYGIKDRVVFVGKLLGGDAVQREIDKCDIFALPSRQEGLPRALMEAMARGAPCFGTTVGGIPELLPEECLVPAGNVGALTDKIMNFCKDSKKLVRYSEENFAKAHEYHFEVVSKQRMAFYKDVKKLSRVSEYD
ncbi:MAG: glycosyltransferase [Candidatus Thiodiazotropha sp. L084R]